MGRNAILLLRRGLPPSWTQVYRTIVRFGGRKLRRFRRKQEPPTNRTGSEEHWRPRGRSRAPPLPRSDSSNWPVNGTAPPHSHTPKIFGIWDFLGPIQNFGSLPVAAPLMVADAAHSTVIRNNSPNSPNSPKTDSGDFGELLPPSLLGGGRGVPGESGD